MKLSPPSLRSRYRILMHAFFDDAETRKENGLVLLCGFIASDATWETFNLQWHSLLSHYGIKRLHTADFLCAQGEYKHLSLSYPDRAKAVHEFIGIIQKTGVCGFAIGVDARAYQIIMSGVKKRIAVEQFCFERLLKRIIECVQGWNYRDPLILVFDDCEEHSMRFYGALRQLKRRKPEIRDQVGGIMFCDDRFVPEIQSADLLACITAKEMRRGADAWKNSPYGNILKDVDSVHGVFFSQEYWDAETIHSRSAEIIAAAQGR